MRKVFILAAASSAVALSACQYVPGTDAYKKAQAEKIAARDLIDPSSAQFRDVYVRDDYVCGEINAKNRMGAYVGFKRFFAMLSKDTAMIDPEFNLSDKLSADELCSSMRTNPYSSLSSSMSACETANEQALTQVAQNLFDIGWEAHCERSEKPPLNMGTSLDTMNVDETLDANMEMNDASVDDVPMDDVSGDDDIAGPIVTSDSPASGNESEQGHADQSWLDEVIRRNPGTGQAASQLNESGPATD